MGFQQNQFCARNLGAARSLVALVPVALLAVSATGAELYLQSFHDFSSNPKNPRADLALGRDGNFYGTTAFGGTNGENGTVFQLTPAGEFTILHSFQGSDGALPSAGVVEGTDGLYYGVAQRGGANGDFGTIFRVASNGDFALLHSFTGLDGDSPQAALVRGNEGDFYGTTARGGTGGDNGTVFKITPGGVFTSLYSFNGTNGSRPTASLIQTGDGQFYGTTSEGGPGYDGTAVTGDGTVFRISPEGTLTNLFYFSQTNGSGPAAGLVETSDGNLYGTTQFGGARGDNGTVFKITPAGAFSTVFSFSGPDGSFPLGDMVAGSDGNLYGTTSGDRSFGGTNTFGTVFRITLGGVLTTLISFDSTNGASPLAGLTRGTDGNLYGTTFEGGSGGGGTIFRLVTPFFITAAAPSGGSVVLTWNSFTNGIYRVEHTPKVTGAGWTELVSSVIATGATTSITNTFIDATGSFYRIRLLP